MPDRAARADTSLASFPDVTSARRVLLLKCPFDPITMAEAVDRALGWCAESRRPHVITTVNASTLVLMGRDSCFAAACRASDMIVADGVPVVWAARLAGDRLPGRIAGVDLMASLLDRASQYGLRVYLLGAREEVLTRLVAHCSHRYPGLALCGWRNGYFTPGDEAGIIETIRGSGAHMLFIGMPSPFKELWCHRHACSLGVPVVLGVGGSFDVLAGDVRRAPAWMQRTGLEWFWRLLMEPRRLWKRYLVSNTLFLAWVAREAIRRRLRSSQAARS